MKKTGTFLLLLIYLFHLFTVMAYADESATGSCHTLMAGKSLAGDEIYTGTAKAVVLYELESQTLVYAHNPDVSINPTGLVKLLTALIVLEEGNLDDIVTVKRSTLNSISAGAVSAGLKSGEEITLRDLLYCVMVSSANDATAVMAEHVAGSQAAFVEKMNGRAATLGCENTYFTNVHGLEDEKQYSTARDLAIIVEEALKNEQFCHYFSVTNHTVEQTNSSAARKLTTTNYMMDTSSKYYDSRVTGGKPAAATSSDRSIICTAQDGNSRYLCVVISAKAKMSGSSVTRYTNFDEAQALLNMGFGGFAIQQVLGTQQPYGMFAVANGENHVVVGADREVYALLPLGFDANQLLLRDVRIAENLKAPLLAGTVVGKLQVYYRSILIGEVDLVGRHDVSSVGTTIQPDVPDDEATHGHGFTLIAVIGILCVSAGIVSILFLKKKAQRSKQKRTAVNRRGV